MILDQEFVSILHSSCPKSGIVVMEKAPVLTSDNMNKSVVLAHSLGLPFRFVLSLHHLSYSRSKL